MEDQYLIKNIIAGSTLYDYYLENRCDEFLESLMNTEFIQQGSAIFFCYDKIIENDKLSIIYDLICKISGFGEQVQLCSRVFKTNNKQLVDNVLALMDQKDFERLFFELLGCFHTCYETHTIIETFLDKINITKLPDSFFIRLGGNEQVSAIKLLVDYGVPIPSNEPLKYACRCKNIDLVDFYLDYGLNVDEEVLRIPFVPRYFSMDIIKIFLKHNIDFSILKYTYNKEEEEIIANLEDHGLDTRGLLRHLMKWKN